MFRDKKNDVVFCSSSPKDVRYFLSTYLDGEGIVESAGMVGQFYGFPERIYHAIFVVSRLNSSN